PDVVIAAADTKFKEGADLVCDSLGQDQLTINQALERLSSIGGWVHLLEGTYTVTGPIVMPGKNVKLTGAGRDITVIRPADGSSMSAIISITSSERHFTFQDFTINGNKGEASVSALILSGAGVPPTRNSISLARVNLVDGSNIGVRADRDWCHWSLEDVSASGMGGSGFSFSECEVFANAVRSVSNGGYGWFCSFGGSLQIINNSIIQDNGNSGFGNGGLLGANARLIIHGSVIHKIGRAHV